jgi:hypothetical protein
MKDLSLKRILVAWASLTVLLAVFGVLVFALDLEAKAFAALANGLNVVPFVGFVLFRKRIERWLAGFLDRSKDISVTIQHRHDRKIGLVMLAVLAAFCIPAVVLAVTDHEAYRQLIKEDGLVEYGSALFWLLAAVVLGIGAMRTARRGTGLAVSLTLLAFFLVCAGEEISWGQRLFDIESPELMSSINVQNEITLHSIGSISVFSNTFFLLTVIFFLVMPFLAKKHGRIRAALHLIHFPVPNRFVVRVYVVSLLVWIIVGVRFGTLGFHPFSVLPAKYYTQMDDEIFEFLAAYSFLCFSILDGLKRVTVTAGREQQQSTEQRLPA